MLRLLGSVVGGRAGTRWRCLVVIALASAMFVPAAHAEPKQVVITWFTAVSIHVY